MSPREHIEQLASELDVPVFNSESDWSAARYTYDPTPWDPFGLKLAPWGTEPAAWEYGIALHELGHAAHRHGVWRPGLAEIVEEAEASVWGLDAMIVVEGVDAAEVAVALASSVSTRLHIDRERPYFARAIEDPNVKRLILAVPRVPDSVMPIDRFPSFIGQEGTWARLRDEMGLADVA